MDDEPSAAAAPARGGGGARRIKAKVRPLRAWARFSRGELTAEGRALVAAAATAPLGGGGGGPSAAALAAKPLHVATARRPAQWRPDGAGDSALEVSAPPIAQTRATLALRVPVLSLWPHMRRRRRRSGQDQQHWRHEADVAVRLPPGLRLAATSRGLPDVRLELLDVLVSWGQREERDHGRAPVPRPSSPSPSSPGGFGGRHHRVHPPSRPSAAFAVRGGALLLAHAMFPDAAARLIPFLALPVAAVDVAGPLALVLAPAGARRAARDLWGGGLGGKSGVKADGPSSNAPEAASPPSPPPLPVRLAAATAHAGVHALRGLSPPAAALASAAWLWRLLEPNSLLMLKGVAALAAVAADYNGLRRGAALGRFSSRYGGGGGEEDNDDDVGWDGGRPRAGGHCSLDAARRRVHRRAARRVAPFMRDLPEGTPPLAPALAALGRVSVAAALAVGGVPLCGGGGGGNGSSFAAAPPSGAAWLGWDPSPSLSPLLQVSVVVDVSAPDAVAAAARRHAASGLDRAELQELFVEGGGNGAATIVKGREDGRGEVAAAAAGAGVVVDAACCGASSSSSASSSPPSPSWGGRRRQDDDGDGKDGFHQHKDDPLAFLDRLPLYGRPEAATAALSPSPPSGPSADGEDAAAIVAAGREGRLVVGGGPVGQLNPLSTARARAEAELALRAFRLALAFLPFVLLGLPLLAAAATLMERARERERQALGIGDDDEDQDQSDDGGNDNDDDESFWSDPARQQRAAAAWRRRQQERERRAAERRAAQRQQQELEQQLMLHSEGQAAVARLLRAQLAALRVAMAAVAALLELLLLLALGGDWMASASSSSPGSGAGTRSGGPFEAAALRLRRAAWSLLLSGCARSGAAVIKCGQWAAVRRDLFAGDLCDALSRLHDDAPSHAPEETRRALERAFGGGPGGGPGGAAASSSSWTRRALERAFGGGPGGAAASSSSWTRVFESFEWQPVASGSIAQVHRAVLRTRSRGGGGDDDDDEGDSDDADDAEGQQPGGLVVAVKVRHPGVARHIAMDFLLLRRLASLAERALRWLAGRGRGSGNGDGPRAPPLVHTLGQFSRTMAAQADLRVEAVHMLRFARDFDAQGGQARLMLSAAAPSAATAATTTTTPPIAVPLPVAGMAAAEVLVETFEPGASVGRHLAAAVAERAMLERRARERRLERRRRERECAERQEQREREHGERQEPTPPSLPDQPQQHQQQQQAAAGPVAACRGKLVGAVRAVASRAAGLGRGARRRARRMCEARGGSPNSSSSRSQIVALFLEAWLHMLLDTGFMHQDLHPGNLLVRARAEGSEGGGGSGSSGSSSSIAGGPAEQQQQQQLVLLDFGLAEELSPDVRRHFVSFLNHVAAGSPAHATRHLLCWSSSGQGEDQRQHRASSSSSSRARRALLADMAELFNSGCDLSSENGIDLDAVLGRVLLLVKKHGVALDGSHALLCMGCCALVRCASALDPEFNLLDAAAPALLCHALTGSRALLGGGGTTAGLLV